MWSMLVVLSEWENENDSKNQCESMQYYVILQNEVIIMAS